MAGKNDPDPAMKYTSVPRSLDRLQALAACSPSMRRRMDELIQLARRGLPRMHQGGMFAHTMRLATVNGNHACRPEGDSLRYAINVALGLSFIDEAGQGEVLGRSTVAELVRHTCERARSSNDAGAIALAAWTAAEAMGIFVPPLYARLSAMLRDEEAVETVTCSWALLAAIAGSRLGDTRSLTELARDRLLEGQGRAGLFPHHLPASASGSLRSHIGCFADQVYSTQALARLSVLEEDAGCLAAAEACADAICRLQGPQGQWWWHYDTRNGSVVEGYPVYSVHQHAMAPMALLDLREAGGTDHMGRVVLGLCWLDRNNEAGQSMVSEEHDVIWRKIGRREPAKLVRAISAAATASRPGLRLPGLDAIFPPGRIDHECRPYELGWLLYAWHCGGVVARLGENHSPARSTGAS